MNTITKNILNYKIKSIETCITWDLSGEKTSQTLIYGKLSTQKSFDESHEEGMDFDIDRVTSGETHGDQGAPVVDQ